MPQVIFNRDILYFIFNFMLFIRKFWQKSQRWITSHATGFFTCTGLCPCSAIPFYVTLLHKCLLTDCWMLPYPVFSVHSACSPQTSGSHHCLPCIAVICVHILFRLPSCKILEAKGWRIIYLFTQDNVFSVVLCIRSTHVLNESELVLSFGTTFI